MSTVEALLNEAKGDFHVRYTEEPHATRRKLILANHPEIKQLYGPDIRLFFSCLFIVAAQVATAWYLRDAGIWRLVLVAYCWGGFFNHSATLAMHELSHNLAFKSPLANRFLGLFVNLPLAVPSSATFKRYHMEHHKYQGHAGVDVDVPTALEGKLLGNIFGKIFFVFFQAAFYAVRPILIRPKKMTVWELLNWITSISFDAAIYTYMGPSSLAYLGLSSLLGLGMHPMAGHFIAEHYVFHPNYETYSYYGPLNWFGFHVGFHNEHHDFPYIPGSRLHKVREMAPEFYNNLPQHHSWVKVIWDFITMTHITPYSRVIRKLKETKVSEDMTPGEDY